MRPVTIIDCQQPKWQLHKVQSVLELLLEPCEMVLHTKVFFEKNMVRTLFNQGVDYILFYYHVFMIMVTIISPGTK